EASARRRGQRPGRVLVPRRAPDGPARLRAAQRLPGPAGVLRRDGGRAASRPCVRHRGRPLVRDGAGAGRGAPGHGRPGPGLRGLPVLGRRPSRAGRAGHRDRRVLRAPARPRRGPGRRPRRRPGRRHARRARRPLPSGPV
ncbi:MAG: hypothetical protein AVDCRST_MAG16-2428, partial [uncultured Frankineae bacterium]